MKYQICNRCVMDTSDPDIQFDENGNCNHCNDFINNTSKIIYQGKKSDDQLKKLIEKIKNSGKKNKYNCLIGVSGGVDSSYVAYLLKKYELSPLAVHVDNGWDSKEAVENIRNICSKLGIDYESYVLDWKEFKDIQLSVLKSSIPEVEMPTDIAITSVLHKIASKYNIKYIIGGGNVATEGILPVSWFYNPKDSKLLKSIQKNFGSMRVNTFPFFDYKMEMYYKLIRGIRIVYLLNYTPFSKENAIQVLQENLEWRSYGGKHHESKYTSFVQSYLQPVKFNLDYRRATFSTQICAGNTTRESAIIQLKKSSFNSEKIDINKEYVCKKLSITIDEFERIMNLPIKSYLDYPNDKEKLEFIYRVYLKYFRRDVV